MNEQRRHPRIEPGEATARRVLGRRSEQARQERMRLRRQRAAAVVLIAVVVLAGGCWGLYELAFAHRSVPASVEQPAPQTGDSTATAMAAARSVRAALRGAQARRRAALLNTPLVPAPKVRTIVLDKPSQTVSLYEADGRFVKRALCSSGVYYPFTGTYRVNARKASSYYPKDGSRFSFFVIFTKSKTGTNIGFHSLPLDKNGVEATGLGQPISHGCVRLARDMAKFVYEWAPIGAKVIVK